MTAQAMAGWVLVTLYAATIIVLVVRGARENNLRDLDVAPLPPEQRTAWSFRYPVLAYPQKVKSFNLDKDPVAGGVLQGIKGQYLIFDGGVINLRKYTGYKVEVLAG